MNPWRVTRLPGGRWSAERQWHPGRWHPEFVGLSLEWIEQRMADRGVAMPDQAELLALNIGDSVSVTMLPLEPSDDAEPEQPA